LIATLTMASTVATPAFGIVLVARFWPMRPVNEMCNVKLSISFASQLRGDSPFSHLPQTVASVAIVRTFYHFMLLFHF